MLSNWAKPSSRDRVTGAWRPLAPRDAGIAAAALRPVLAQLLAGPDQVQQLAIQLTGQLGLGDAGPDLAKIVTAAEWPAPNRAAALAALGRLHFAGLSDAVERAADDPEPIVRAAAVRLAARLAPERALKLLDAALAGDSLRERQAAFAVLAEMKTPAADERLATWLDRLIPGQVPPGLRLDLIAAATLRGTPTLNAELKLFAAAKSQDDPLADYRECLEGGDAEARAAHCRRTRRFVLHPLPQGGRVRRAGRARPEQDRPQANASTCSKPSCCRTDRLPKASNRCWSRPTRAK